MVRRLLMLILIQLIFISIVFPGVSYKDRMIDLIHELKKYTNQYDKPFYIISQNGHSLININQNIFKLLFNKNGSNGKYFNSIDGISFEFGDYSYFLNRDIQKKLQLAHKADIKVFLIGYEKDCKKIEKIYDFARRKNYAAYISPSYNLDVIPNINFANSLSKENLTLQNVDSFIYMINPAKYKTKKEFLKELKKSDYDLLIIDLFFNKEIINKKEVNSLKKKNNGKKRIVLSYLSVGEAENYRYYWKRKWNYKKPSFVLKQNERWPNSYIVKFWDMRWVDILKDYLDKINESNFDGVVFDVVDTHIHFDKEE
ncbi:MAG: hypothetical protein FXF47_05910 [Candidatus Mcinerneyibacterium aminivorans]|uniref:Glycoside-hydrolase family GH114 TIM-barrel domain-containing protein n=1 Tax=Candidatus Mcinerneyibacterium aminivorans TaxID=2703815 RepID=A0A5D0MI46_9BACT|nr:MAG: hypothetical protein FXF47_05910 [Candidatus Mcinerneyibacterium aminivorans]